ncbi:Response regulator MprA [compost metagenome]
MIDNLVMDRDSKNVQRGGKSVILTATEYRLLEYLMVNKNRILSRVDILEEVWGIDFNMSTNVVDVYVNYLRKKIDYPTEKKLIHTVIGMGYILRNEN